jgi:hypothetical protein
VAADLPLIARRAELAILTGAIEAAECGRGACSPARREETISSRPTRRTETIALGQRAASSESSLTPQALLRFAVAVLDEAHDESDPASAARVGGGWDAGVAFPYPPEPAAQAPWASELGVAATALAGMLSATTVSSNRPGSDFFTI